MDIIDFVFLVAVYLVFLPTLYLVALAVAAYFFRKKVAMPAEPFKIAVVVPSHNEELNIGVTVRSLLQCRYPGEHYQVMVIADNCSDQTAAVARAAGARVFTRVDPDNRGKGQALDWFFQSQIEAYRPFAALALIDADTLVDENFLTQIAASLSHPEVKVVQGFYGASNPQENWRTALVAAALCLFHHLRPAGRNRIGGSAGLKGNGMGFRREVIEKYGWPAHSIVEDLEFSVLLLLDEVLVHYNPDAMVFGEMASQRQQADTQRQRWESGRWQILRNYGGRLFLSLLTKFRCFFFDGLMDLLIPTLSMLVAGVVGLLVVAWFFFPQMTNLLLFCLVGLAFCVFSGLGLRRAPLRVWFYLAAAPLFILWKVPINAFLMIKKYGGTWIRTPRQAELKRKP